MGKTVTTYLIDGDPKGTQYSFISNKICQMFVVPRSNLSYLNEQEKLQKPAFYILIGEDEAAAGLYWRDGELQGARERPRQQEGVLAKSPYLRFEGRGHDEGGRAISGAQSHRRGEKGEYVCPWREQADSQGTQPARASA